MPHELRERGHSRRAVMVVVECGTVGRAAGGAKIGGPGGKLATNCRNVGEPTLASALVEPELQR